MSAFPWVYGGMTFVSRSEVENAAEILATADTKEHHHAAARLVKAAMAERVLSHDEIETLKKRLHL